jgi:hypothetical protein
LPGERLATSNLLGANEVPPVAITATGAAAFVLNYKQDSLRYEAVFNDLSSKATAVEIVDGRRGENGPVRYALTLTQEGMAVMGTLNITEMDVEELQKVPSRLYMNVHTAINPSGEIRGQIVYH